MSVPTALTHGSSVTTPLRFPFTLTNLCLLYLPGTNLLVPNMNFHLNQRSQQLKRQNKSSSPQQWSSPLKPGCFTAVFKDFVLCLQGSAHFGSGAVSSAQSFPDVTSL